MRTLIPIMGQIVKNMGFVICIFIMFGSVVSCTSWKYLPNQYDFAKHHRIKGKPKKIVWYQYQQSGELLNKSTYTFNKNGLLIQKNTEIHNPGEKVRYSHSSWIYDENGFLIMELQDLKRTDYVNDRRGRVKKSKFYSHPDSAAQISTYKYLPRKRKRLQKGYDYEGKLYSQGEVVYDKQNNVVYSIYELPNYKNLEEVWYRSDEYGNTVESKVKSTNLSDTLYTFMEYDANHHKVWERYVDEKKHVRIQTYIYRVDSLRNWIERTKDEGSYRRKEKREITYY